MAIPKLKVCKLFPDAQVPKRAYPTDSAVDTYAYRFEQLYRQGELVEEENGLKVQEMKSVTLRNFDRVLINTGISVTVGKNYEIQIRSRSGLPLKQGLIIMNGIGTIDEQYRGPLGVAIGNVSGKAQTLSVGDRIAQLVVAPVILSEVEILDSLEETDRGARGFGSTGNK